MKNLLQGIWYRSVRSLLKIGLFFTLKKISVKGKENIPKKGPILFIGNHQNAFIDAILIPTTNNRITYFLARANVFKNKHIAKVLKWSNMYPVYRMRDGASTVKNNHKIFESCHEILNSGGALEIFGEGMHHLDRKVYPMKKGFARIIHGTLSKYPNLDIKIIPVGINYDHHINFPASASVIYGTPISANDLIDVNTPDLGYNVLRSEVLKALKKLTLHIEETENYDAVIKEIEAKGVNYLDPEKAYEIYNNRAKLPTVIKNTKVSVLYRMANFIWKINSCIPLGIWYKLSKNIKEVIFTNTFRFAVGLTLFPLFYFLQALLVGLLINKEAGILYLLSTLILCWIKVKKGTIQQL